MTMTRRKMLRVVLGTGGAFVAAGAGGLDWLERRLDAGTPLAGRPPGAPGTAGATSLLPPTPACHAGDAHPTEAETAGPFYTPNTPERTVLREPGTVGTPLRIEGRVLSTDCRPLAGAVLDFWSCDGNGVYDNEGFRLRGHQFADAAGAYRVETVKPASYGQYGGRRTPHVHVKVQGRGTRLLTTQLYFPGEPLNAQDGLFKESLLVQLARAEDGSLVARFDFVLA
jgi:protocatechuate 3,4-dioxygenase beta subunit